MKKEENQTFLFKLEEDWKEEWQGMPEYNNTKAAGPEIEAIFKFRSKKEFDKFHAVIKKYLYGGEKVFDGRQRKTRKSTWFPLNNKASKYTYTSCFCNPKFPIYIVSKGRWERRPTSNALELMNVPYYIVVEEQEYKNYASVVETDKILVLPKKYLVEYDTFWKRGEDDKTGPGAARNFCWEHSLESGFKWHWVLDDNIESFERFNKNMKIKCETGAPFHVIEDFVLRYRNIAQAGMGYAIFCPASENRPAVRLNTRIYSCILIRNDIPYRWRGRYNEDTDLSLRALKDGWVTVEFNAFLIGKRATQTMRGGNTDEFYNKEGTLPKSQILADMHPDVASVVRKFNRWHHHVNYKPFKTNRLIKKAGAVVPKGINNYGMVLVDTNL